MADSVLRRYKGSWKGQSRARNNPQHAASSHLLEKMAKARLTNDDSPEQHPRRTTLRAGNTGFPIPQAVNILVMVCGTPDEGRIQGMAMANSKKNLPNATKATAEGDGVPMLEAGVLTYVSITQDEALHLLLRDYKAAVSTIPMVRVVIVKRRRVEENHRQYEERTWS